MKANELMIGDWVKLKNTNSYFKPECIFYNAIRIETTGHHLEDVEIDKFEPISLTSDILEKNNMMHYDGEDACIRYKNGELYIGSWVAHITFHTGMIKYVHELQQALRLCKLNILANNFKI